MSVRKLAAGILTTLLTLGTVSAASGQGNAPPVDPFAFDPQFRWFEPVYDIDLEELKPEKRAATGWFATYDRLNLYGSRPENASANLSEGDTQLDAGWGHRYEVGYLQPQKDTGWTFTSTENNVSELFTVRSERGNRFVTAGNGSTATNSRGQIVPAFAGNNLNFANRFVDVNQTINQLDYESYEFNKTWRLTPFHNGGILEPMVGFRYADLHDTNLSDSFSGIFDLTTPGGALGILGPQESFNRLEADTVNQVYAGQAGFRYFKHKGRFNYVADFRGFLGGARQFSTFQSTTVTESFGDDGMDTTVDIGDPGTRIDIDQTAPLIRRDDSFVAGFDLRGTVGYQLTRMIQLRTGFQLVNYGTGIWRGGAGDGPGLIGDRNQDFVLFGGTFGISLNH